METRRTFIAAAILVAVIGLSVAGYVRQSNQSVTFVNTGQQYAQDTCVPQDSYVLNLYTQMVNQVVAPECAAR